MAGSLTETEVTKCGALSGGEEKISRIYIYIKAPKGRKEESATQGLFPLIPVVTLIMGLGTTYFFNYIRSGNHRFPRISEGATITYTEIHLVNQTCAQA